MTDADDGRDDQSVPSSPDSPAPPQSGPPPQPGYGYLPRPKPRRAVWFVAGLAALIIVPGAVVAIGAAGRHSADQRAEPAAAPVYSMTSVSNACDLVDPAPLKKWSPTLTGPPRHEEVRPSVQSAGSLSCRIDYSSGDGLDTAEIIVDVDFTDGDAPPFYDDWKRGDLAKTGAGLESGPITGVGTQGYWHSETFGDLVINTRYLLAAVDGNASVRVRLTFSRSDDHAQVHRTELEQIAEAQVRKALNGLTQH